MNFMDKRLNPDNYQELSLKELSTVTKEEALAWGNHPCTKSLFYSLNEAMNTLLLSWLDGRYTVGGSSDGTAQKQALALGKAQAIDDIIETITAIKKLDLVGEEDDSTDRT